MVLSECSGALSYASCLCAQGRGEVTSAGKAGGVAVKSSRGGHCLYVLCWKEKRRSPKDTGLMGFHVCLQTYVVVLVCVWKC